MSEANGSGKIALSFISKTIAVLFAVLLSVIGFLLVLGLNDIDKNQIRIETKLDVFVKEMNDKIDGDNGIRERIIRLELRNEMNEARDKLEHPKKGG